MSTVRVFLVDDNFIARRGLRSVLENEDGIVVVGEASSGAEAIKRLSTCECDVILMDIRMPNMSGVEATAALLKQNPNARILVATVIDDPTIHMNAMQAGAKGYMVYGHFTPEELVAGIRATAQGKKVNVPVFQISDNASATISFSEALTRREEEILRLIAAGNDNREIASLLIVEEKTVKNHINSIYSKIGVTNRQEAVYYMLSRMFQDLE